MGHSVTASLVVPIAWPAPGPELIGGKATALCQLAGAGLPVPRGGVLTTAAHRSFIAGGSAVVAHDVREAMRTALSFARRETHTAAVAVRSSAPQEDATNAAYAGQYHTELNVRTEEDVEAAVKRCWSSSRSRRVAAYAERRGVHRGDALIAVILQELIHSTAAGVLFSIDPLTGDRANMYIEAAHGLCETVVRGEVDPDRCRVNRLTNSVEIRVGQKAIMAIAGPTGVRRVAVDADSQARSILTPDIARSLATLTREAEKILGGPVDIEWALCEGRLYLLQARPITSATATRR